MSTSLNDANGKIMTNGGQISKKLQKPFHSEVSPELCILAFPLPCPACFPTSNTKRKKKKKSESRAEENESSPEVTAASLKEKSRDKGNSLLHRLLGLRQNLTKDFPDPLQDPLSFSKVFDLSCSKNV